MRSATLLTARRFCSSSSSSTSDFLASLLAASKTSSSSSSSSNNKKPPTSNLTAVPLLFNPAALRLDVGPKGLSLREREAELNRKKQADDAAAAQPHEDAATPQDKIRFPKFDDQQQSDHQHHHHHRRKKNSVVKLTSSETEVSFALLSVSRRMGDWEEAMRIASQQQQQLENGTTATATAAATTMGMLAQAAWACARAVQLQQEEEEDVSSEAEAQKATDANSSVSNNVTVSGPVESLNAITQHVIQQIESDRDAAPAFLRAVAGNLISLSEALRSCGGIDLVVALDTAAGEVLRKTWRTKGLLLETQRWHHEVVKVFDLCDDWRGALAFFMQHCGVQETDQTTSSNAVNNSKNEPSILGATTIALLMELLNRNEKQRLVSELLQSKLIRESERAAIGRAYAVLINSWSNANSMRRGRDGSVAASASSSSSGGGGVTMPKMNLDQRWYRSQS